MKMLDLKKNAEFYKKVWQESSFAYNVVNVSTSPFSYILKNVVGFALYVHYKINITNNRNLGDFLPTIGDDSEHISMIRM